LFVSFVAFARSYCVTGAAQKSDRGSSDRYREFYGHAEMALRMALGARTDQYRASWLQLAQGWLKMMPPDRLAQAVQDSEIAAKTLVACRPSRS
jgi:hypothetical protein